jgi:hypothetical protein
LKEDILKFSSSDTEKEIRVKVTNSQNNNKNATPSLNLDPLKTSKMHFRRKSVKLTTNNIENENFYQKLNQKNSLSVRKTKEQNDFGEITPTYKISYNRLADIPHLTAQGIGTNGRIYQAILMKADTVHKELFFMKLWDPDYAYDDKKIKKSKISKWNDLLFGETNFPDQTLGLAVNDNIGSNVSNYGKRTTVVNPENKQLLPRAFLPQAKEFNKVALLKESLYSNKIKITKGFRSLILFILALIIFGILLALSFQIYAYIINRLEANYKLEKILLLWESAWKICASVVAINKRVTVSLSRSLSDSEASDNALAVN